MLIEKASLLTDSLEAKEKLERQINTLRFEKEQLEAKLGEAERLLASTHETKDNYNVITEELELARDNFGSLEAS